MPRTILATYRLQLHAGFDFDAAAALVDYLAALGVTHLYSSPCLQAVPGSLHGYDVVDPGRVNRDLGGTAAHQRLCHALREHDLGQILDVVPNHMAITGTDNAWWWDVLENGPASRYAMYFDVDWHPPEAKLHDLILVPILHDHYGRVLEAGDITLERSDVQFTVRYRDHRLPLAPRTLDTALGIAAGRCGSDALAAIADAFGRLPPSTTRQWSQVARRHRDKEWLRGQLKRLCHDEPEIGATIDQVIADLNGDADALDALLERQNYRLAFWRTAERELGYRRFFDINTLVGLRVEDDIVFADTHRLVLDWLQAGVLDGLRIDHPDGLLDPEGYFRRLRAAAPEAWIVAEKILMPGEELRQTWSIDGSTGYEFLRDVGSLFVAASGEAALTAVYEEFTGESSDYTALMRDKKLLVLHQALATDVNRLTALLVTICERHRRHRDYTRHQLHEAVREVAACFPVYRTYVRSDPLAVADDDERAVGAAIAAAKAHGADLDAELFDFLGDLLLLRIPGAQEAEFALRFQQLTGPVMAKGVEDTAFYCFNRLVSLNEVGGDPRQFGISVDAFHATCRAAQERWPRRMLTTSTHDTKRSEDVRARISLLSEIPMRWRDAVTRWAQLNERHRVDTLPDRNMEYLLYQTLVGTWPLLEAERIAAYMEKASREAKVHTSWTMPSVRYDEALQAFVKGVLSDPLFRAELDAFVTPLLEPGRITSLAQLLIKMTAPGVPDLYQGSELWDANLVDPDNRRPVDYARRRQLLAQLDGATPETIWARRDEGVPKLWVIRQSLAVRRTHPECFGAEGDYQALAVAGERATHVVAFTRARRVVTVVPRLVVGLGGDWGDTTVQLPPGRWRNALTQEEVAGGRVPLAQLSARFPVGLLHRAGVPE